jgi:hypothetical protein
VSDWKFELTVYRHRKRGRRMWRVEFGEVSVRACRIIQRWPTFYGPTPEIAMAKAHAWCDRAVNRPNPELFTEEYSPRSQNS